MKNRLIAYGRQKICASDVQAVINTLKSDFLTQGPKVSTFEEKVTEHHNAKYGVAFCNGTAALHAAYYAAGVARGDEIITSPITFAATANAAVYCGGVPVFVDIDLQTNCIDIQKIEDRITDKTKVITPVSLAGYPVNLREIKQSADKYDCLVIHDAAHAIGSKRDGTFGMEYVDMAILSFHPVKHITTAEGGMVLTNSKELYDKLMLFRNHGITKNPESMSQNEGPWYYEMQSLGWNYRLSDVHAALGISQFERIGSNLKRRNKIAKYYNEQFSDSPHFIIPPDMGFSILDDEKAPNIHSYHLYTLRMVDANKRLEFYTYLHDNGILAQIHYIPLHWQPYYQEKFGYEKGDFPNAELYYNSEISIPMYHGMEDADVEYVVERIKNVSR